MLVCLAVVVGPAWAQLSDDGEFLEGIVAVVNDGVVLTSELDQELAGVRANIRAQGLRSPPSAVLESQVLERLVLREIQLQRAKRLGIEISDEQVNRALGFVAQ
ncbi:MAG: SurA N-terminal domain-containing protein, partial [Gammaproteobacteria bacterium]|nr:SurA N-terminal domain-containing protein [Gammaproteobacteria bacterium]